MGETIICQIFIHGTSSRYSYRIWMAHPATVTSYPYFTISPGNGYFILCTNGNSTAHTSGPIRLSQSYYSYNIDNVSVSNSLVKDIIFGANRNFQYYTSTEYIDYFRSDQVLYGFFTVLNGQLGNSSTDWVASCILANQSGKNYQIRPIIYLNSNVTLTYNRNTGIWNIQ